MKTIVDIYPQLESAWVRGKIIKDLYDTNREAIKNEHYVASMKNEMEHKEHLGESSEKRLINLVKNSNVFAIGDEVQMTKKSLHGSGRIVKFNKSGSVLVRWTDQYGTARKNCPMIHNLYEVNKDHLPEIPGL